MLLFLNLGTPRYFVTLCYFSEKKFALVTTPLKHNVNNNGLL